ALCHHHPDGLHLAALRLHALLYEGRAAQRAAYGHRVSRNRAVLPAAGSRHHHRHDDTGPDDHPAAPDDQLKKLIRKRRQTTIRNRPNSTSSLRFGRAWARRAPMGAVQMLVGTKRTKPSTET